jgi:hypothetical protein
MKMLMFGQFLRNCFKPKPDPVQLFWTRLRPGPEVPIRVLKIVHNNSAFDLLTVAPVSEFKFYQNFFLRGSRVKKIPDPHQRIKVFLTKKIVCKLSEIWSGMFIPDPDEMNAVGSHIWSHASPPSNNNTGRETSFFLASPACIGRQASLREERPR